MKRFILLVLFAICLAVLLGDNFVHSNKVSVDVKRLLLLINEKEKQLTDVVEVIKVVETEIAAFGYLEDKSASEKLIFEKSTELEEFKALQQTLTDRINSYKILLLRDRSIVSCSQVTALGLPFGMYYIVEKEKLMHVSCGVEKVSLSFSNIHAPIQTVAPLSNIGQLNLVLHGMRNEKGLLSKKESTNAWDSSAISTDQITDKGEFQGVTFKAGQNNMNLMAGLTQGQDKGFGFADISHAIHLNNANNFMVFELGVSRGTFGKYEEEDEFRVYIQHDQVAFAHNGKVFYTSTVAPRYPLIFDSSFQTPGARIYDVNLIRVNDNPPEHIVPGQAIYWRNVHGAITSPGYIKRTLAGSAWNSGASSVRSIQRLDNVGGVSFTVGGGNQESVLGLSAVDRVFDFREINFAIYLNERGFVSIAESGTLFGPLQPYFKGDNFTIQLMREGNSVIYTHNGVPFHTSDRSPTFPLLVDSSLLNENSYLFDVSWTASYEYPNSNVAQGERVEFRRFRGAMVRDGILFKTFASAAWNSAVTSAAVITENSDVRGITFKANQHNLALLIGLGKDNKDDSINDIDFAITLQSDSKYSVYESGKLVAVFGSYQKSDTFSIVIYQDIVKYMFDGTVFYTSTIKPTYPMHVDTSFLNQHAGVFDLFYISEDGVLQKKPEIVLPGQPVFWKNVHGVRSKPGYQKKSMEVNAWNAGSLSIDTVTIVSKIGGVTFKTTANNLYSIIGLTSDSRRTVHTAIDYAIYMHNNGMVYVFEKGTFIGPFNKYVANDRFDISVTEDNTQIVYLQNGLIFYTSSHRPKLPLHVDNSLFSIDSCQFDIMWVSKYSFNQDSAKSGNIIYFRNINGLSYSEGTLEKIRNTAAWDSSAFSTVSVDNPSTKDNQSNIVTGFSFTAASRGRIVIGLSNKDTTSSFTDINYGIHLNHESNIFIYESGTLVYSLGRYELGDIFKIIVSRNIVYYYRNGQSFYTSKKVPSFPLFVDVSMLDFGAIIKNIVFETTKFVPPSSAIVGGPLFWKDIFGCASEPGFAFKTQPSNGWNAGLASVHTLEKEGSVGGLSFRAADLQTTAVGLSRSNVDISVDSIDYAIQIHQNGHIYILERGVSRGMYHSYQKGDTFSIQFSRIDGRVRYIHAGRVFYTSNVPIVYPLMGDARFHTQGNIYNVTWTEEYLLPALDDVKSGSYIQSFGNIVGVQFKTEKIYFDNRHFDTIIFSKTKPGSAWDASLSTRSRYVNLNSNVRGFSFKARRDNQIILSGLSEVDTQISFQDIQFGILLNSDKTFQVFESGVSRGVFGTYKEHDDFSVVVAVVGKGNEPKVFYLRNGMAFYTSLIEPKFPLLTDIAFHSADATIYDVKYVNLIDSMGFSMDAPEKPNDLVKWGEVRGVASKAGYVTRQFAGVGWNAGTNSILSIERNSGIVGVSFKVGSPAFTSIGLSTTPNTAFTYTAMDYSFYFDNESRLYILEKNTNRGIRETYERGDTFEIKIVDERIHYTKNGRTIFVSNVVPNFPLRINTSMYDLKSELLEVKWLGNNK